MTARDNITGHYGGDGEIARRIDEQLRLSGVADDHNLSPSDLAALDQFHVGGSRQRKSLRDCFRRHAGLTFWILVPGWAALRVIWRPITAAA